MIVFPKVAVVVRLQDDEQDAMDTGRRDRAIDVLLQHFALHLTSCNLRCRCSVLPAVPALGAYAPLTHARAFPRMKLELRKIRCHLWSFDGRSLSVGSDRSCQSTPG